MTATIADVTGKPRLPFCWMCSRKLRANFHRVVVVDGVERIVHAACLREMERDAR